MTSYDVQAGTATPDMLDALGLESVRSIKANPESVQVRTKSHDVEDLGDRVLRFIVSDESTDRMGDIIRQDGWSLGNYKRNPVILWGHDDGQPPIGKSISQEVVDRRGPALAMDVMFAPRKASEFADTVYELARGGYLKATSVGFMPLATSELDAEEAKAMGLGPYGVEYTKSEMLETSVVSVPANPNAVREGLKKLVVKGRVGALQAEAYWEVAHRTLERNGLWSILKRHAAEQSTPVVAQLEEVASALDGRAVDCLERILVAVQAQTRELGNLRRSLPPESIRSASRGSHPGDILRGIGDVAASSVADLDAALNKD